MRLGSSGRGLVSAAPAEDGLLESRVTRSISGEHDVEDGRDVVLGAAVSLSGTAAHLLPGARFNVGFCDGCPPSPYSVPGSLTLAWLDAPDTGIARIFVNDVDVGEIRHALVGASDVRFFEVPVLGESHVLSIVVENVDGGSSGPVRVLSVTGEVMRPGVVVDAHSLAETTGMTMQRFRQDLLRDQVYRRHYDLVVLGWGTHEARLADLDQATYHHHFERTLSTLLKASEGAACLVLGPLPESPLVGSLRKGREDQGSRDTRASISAKLVESVQRDLAAQNGCAHFSTERAGQTLTRAPRKNDEESEILPAIADLLIRDLFAWQQYEEAKEDELLSAPKRIVRLPEIYVARLPKADSPVSSVSPVSPENPVRTDNPDARSQAPGEGNGGS
jgi:hypothetical protein